MIIETLKNLYSAIGATWQDYFVLSGFKVAIADLVTLAIVIAFFALLICSYAFIRSFFK